MNWVYITAIATYILGLITTYLGRLYNLLWMQVRIPQDSVIKVYRELNSLAKYKIILNDSL